MRVTSIEINNFADGEREANADRNRADAATRETYYNPGTSRRDVARDVLCGNSRLQAFPGFIAGSRWLTVYLHIVGEFRRRRYAIERARTFIFPCEYAFYTEHRIYFELSLSGKTAVSVLKNFVRFSSREN